VPRKSQRRKQQVRLDESERVAEDSADGVKKEQKYWATPARGQRGKGRKKLEGAKAKFRSRLRQGPSFGN